MYMCIWGIEEQYYTVSGGMEWEYQAMSATYAEAFKYP